MSGENKINTDPEEIDVSKTAVFEHAQNFQHDNNSMENSDMSTMTQPDELDMPKVAEPEYIEEVNIEKLAEPDETEEIEKEIKNAIDDVVKDSKTETIATTSTGFDMYDHNAHEEFQTSYSNILKYWAREDTPTELSTYYDKKESQTISDGREAILAQQAKDYNTAIKTNFNAKMKNEMGGSMPGTEETFQEHERNIIFKALNPGLWKFMYDSSAYMVFSAK